VTLLIVHQSLPRDLARGLPHDNTYILLNRTADQEYACLCSDFPGDKK
jgi:hypothetical protein